MSVLFLFVTFVHANVKHITLDEAIQLAMVDNLQIISSERELNAAEARLNRTISYFLPKMGAETRYEFYDSSLQQLSGGTSNLFLEWNIYNGSRDWFDRKAKSIELNQARAGNEKQRILTKAGVEAQFYKLLSLVDSLKTYEASMKRNDGQKAAAQQRRAAGLSTDSDVLEFDLYQSELQAEMLNIESELRRAQAEFRERLGQKNSEISYFPQGQLIHYHIDESLADLKKRMKNESQTLIAAKYEVEQAEANKRIVMSGYLPQISLKASYGSRGLNDTQATPETMLVGTAKWELFSGFDTFYARNEASAIMARAESTLQQVELSVNSQLEAAYARLKAIQDRVDIESDNKIKAQKLFNTVAAEYKRGVKNSNDMRSASRTLLQVILRDIQYRAEFFEQKALLEKALGGEVKISRGSLSGHKD